MSHEGFLALAGEVLDELNDLEINHAFERLGFPPKDMAEFTARVVTSFQHSHGEAPMGEEQLVIAGEMLVVGLLLGFKAGQWRERASAA